MDVRQKAHSHERHRASDAAQDIPKMVNGGDSSLKIHDGIILFMCEISLREKA